MVGVETGLTLPSVVVGRRGTRGQYSFRQDGIGDLSEVITESCLRYRVGKVNRWQCDDRT